MIGFTFIEQNEKFLQRVQNSNCNTPNKNEKSINFIRICDLNGVEFNLGSRKQTSEKDHQQKSSEKDGKRKKSDSNSASHYKLFTPKRNASQQKKNSDVHSQSHHHLGDKSMGLKTPSAKKAVSIPPGHLRHSFSSESQQCNGGKFVIQKFPSLSYFVNENNQPQNQEQVSKNEADNVPSSNIQIFSDYLHHIQFYGSGSSKKKGCDISHFEISAAKFNDSARLFSYQTPQKNTRSNSKSFLSGNSNVNINVRSFNVYENQPSKKVKKSNSSIKSDDDRNIRSKKKTIINPKCRDYEETEENQE